MKADISRNTFDHQNRFSRVLMQQGRVLLDADWNEQTSILLHYLRTLAADLIGPHGGPDNGFEIGCTEMHGAELVCDFTIGWGHYYVDGILVENLPPVKCPPSKGREPLRYSGQPDYPLEDDEKLEHGKRYLVYLDVWERHLTYVQADYIREVALSGPDTATRAKVVWQVKVADEDQCGHDMPEDATCEDLLQAWVKDKGRTGCLRARARVEESSDDPCIIPPQARYRGAENQLYRVEIHDPGGAGDGKHGATYKWSRDNGSVVFPIRALQGKLVTLDTLGPDQHRTLKEGDWVEIIDDRAVLRGEPGIMAMVDAVDRVRFEVMLAVPGDPHLPVFDENTDTHPLLRRWDQGSGPVPVKEGEWTELEDGVQICFEPDGNYHTGDYWLIPARVATGDILWPTEVDADGNVSSKALPPKGIQHHYAPLALISLNERGEVSCDDHDCRCIIEHRCTHAERTEDVGFQPGSDELTAVTEAVAIRNADAIRRRFDADRNLQVRIMGYSRSSEELSNARAEVVRDVYVARGINPERIVISAVESDDSMTTEKLARVVTRLVPVSRATVIREDERPTEVEKETRTREGGVAALVRIANVGNVRAEQLIRSGHDTPEAIASLSAREVSSLLNVNEPLAEKILESAREIAGKGE